MITRDSTNRNSFVVVLFLLVVLFVLIPIVETRISYAHISPDYSEDVAGVEQCIISSTSYIPESIVTIVNDTTLQLGYLWEVSYSNPSNYNPVGLSTFARTVNVPVLNITSLSFEISFYVQNGPRSLTLTIQDKQNRGRIYTEDTAHISSNQNATLSITISPDIFDIDEDIWAAYSIYTTIEAEGHYNEDFVIKSYTITAEVSADLYPVIVDIQRTNGESLFSYPTFSETYDYYPWNFIMSFSDVNSTYYAHLTEFNEHIFLPPNMYNITFQAGQRTLNATLEHMANAAIVEWRLQTLKIDIVPTQNLPDYGIKITSSYSDYYGTLITEKPSFILLAPKENFTVTIIGRSHLETNSFLIAGGENRNITLTVNYNLIDLGFISITLGRLIMLISGVLSIIILLILMSIFKLGKDRFLPFMFLIMSYMVPWSVYRGYHLYPRLIPVELYEINRYDFPGLGASSSQIPGSSILLLPELNPYIPILALALLCALLGCLPNIKKSKQNFGIGDLMLLGSSSIIFVIQLWYLYMTRSLNIGVFLVGFGIILWIALFRVRKRNLFILAN